MREPGPETRQILDPSGWSVNPTAGARGTVPGTTEKARTADEAFTPAQSEEGKQTWKILERGTRFCDRRSADTIPLSYQLRKATPLAAPHFLFN